MAATLTVHDETATGRRMRSFTLSRGRPDALHHSQQGILLAADARITDRSILAHPALTCFFNPARHRSAELTRHPWGLTDFRETDPNGYKRRVTSRE